MTVVMDGTGITPGTVECNCGPGCEMPCWQRLGIAPACTACGCRPFGVEAPSRGIAVDPDNPANEVDLDEAASWCGDGRCQRCDGCYERAEQSDEWQERHGGGL